MSSTKNKIPVFRQIIYLTIPILLFLVFAEILLSVVDRERIMVRGDDPGMVYSFYPDRKAVASTDEYRTTVKIDSIGLRTCENTPSGGNHEKSIFVLGDSFAEGWGVSCEKSFVGLLQSKLSPNGIVYNGGIHGGTVSYYVLRSRYYAGQIRPDRVILQIFDNDLDDLDKISPYISLDDSGRVDHAAPAKFMGISPNYFTRQLKESALYRFSKRVYGLIAGAPVPIKYYKPGRERTYTILSHEEAIQKYGAIEPLKDLSVDYNGQFEFYRYSALADVKSDEKWNSGFERMKRYLNQLLDDLVKINPDVRLTVLYIPANEVFAIGGISGEFTDRSGKPVRKTVNELRASNPLYQLLDEFAHYPNVDLMDGQDILWSHPNDLYYPGDAHLNEEGHRVVAKSLIPLFSH